MKTVLVVDDDPALLRVLARVLGDRHDVVSHSSLAAASDALATRKFDAVLVDVHMHHMTGVAFVEEARRRHPTLAGCFIFMSGDPQSAPPGYPFLVKPFDLDALEAAIAACSSGE